MDVFLENIKKPDQQIQSQTLENISKLLNDYVENDNIFSYTTDDQINSFFKNDLFRFTNLFINALPKDFNEVIIQDNIVLLMESYLSILNKNVFSICIPFSALIVGLKKLANFKDSFFYNILSVDLLMNLTESFNSEPSINLLDFILLISSCIDTEESQIDDAIMFGEISEATISLFTDTNFHKYDSNVISRIFTSIINIINDSSNGTELEFMDDSFSTNFFNSLIKILQCDSFEKQNISINCLEQLLVKNKVLFFDWASKVNPYIALNSIEGIDQIVIEISHLISKIASCHIIPIDQETLEKFIIRIDNADLSQKKTFVNNFGILASNSSEEIVLKVIKDYIEKHEKTSDINLYSFLGSCAIFTLNTKPNVSQFLINFLEEKIPEFFNSNENKDNSIMTVLDDIYKASPSDMARMKIFCTNYFINKEQKVPKYIYTLMLSIFNNLEPVEASNFLDQLIIYDDKNEPLFDNLLARIVLNCSIPLKANQSIYLLQKLTESESKLDILFEIMKKRGTNIIEVNSWVSQIPLIAKTKPIKIALKFINKVIPNFYYLPFETYLSFYLEFLLILMGRYIKENDDQLREEIFECFYTHMIMYNINARYNFLLNYFLYFQTYYSMHNYTINARLADFLRKAIIRSEYYINPSYFNIRRHRPIKKEKGGFDLSVSRIKQGFYVHVYQNTIVRDLLYTIGLFDNVANLSEISLKKVNDQIILENDTTLSDNNINENTEIEAFHNSPKLKISSQPQIFSLMIQTKLMDGVKFIMEILFSESINANLYDSEFYLFLKSIWKIIKIIATPNEVIIKLNDTEYLFNVLFKSKNPFKKLYYMQEIANKAKKDPNYLTYLSQSKLIENIAKLLLDLNIKENLRVEILKILIYYSRINILNYLETEELIKIIPTLATHFINSKKIKSRKLILELIYLIFNSSNIDETFRINNSNFLINNDQFFKICIFTNESLIVQSLRLFSTLSEISNEILFKKFVSYFDIIINTTSNNLILTEDYFQLFGAILPSINSTCFNEADEIFQKCVLKLKDYSYKWFNNIAELVSIFMSKMNKVLDEQSIVDLINFVFNDCDNVEYSSVFLVLKQVFQTADLDAPFYSYLVQDYIEKFKTDRWNYSPSIHKKREKYCGLRNLGSTCYMNSILQLLVNNNNFFNKTFSIENPTPIVVQMRELFAHLECSNLNYANTEQFANHWKEVEYPPFDPRIQEDAAEFLHILLDKLPDEIKEPFLGNLINSFNGISVDFHHDIQERFYTLEIPILPDFFESMRSIVKPQMFIGNNQYMSEEKGKIDVERTTKIVQFPRNLVIQLKRFDFNVKQGKRTKINDEFMFPLAFNTKECFPDIDESQSFDYILTGVITHSGTADGGHYNSILRRILNDNENEWICFNDAEVSRISEEKFWSLSKGDSSQVAAYLLFYEWNDSIFKSQLDEDKKSKIESSLVEKITKENHKITQIRSLFTEPMARFIINLSTPSILIKYYTHVLCHSNLTNIIKLYTNEIIKESKENPDLIAENINEEYTEIFDALINSTDEMAQSIIDVLSNLYKVVDNSFDIHLLDNISSNIVNHLNNFVSLWRVYERFGKIVEVICSNHLEIALMYNYFDSMVSLMFEFYNMTTGAVAIENINLSPFFNSINILIDSINSQESLNKLIHLIELYGEKISRHQKAIKTFIKNGIAKKKLPNSFQSLTDEKVEDENILDTFLKCRNNRDFISFLSSLKNVTTPNNFFEDCIARDPYIFSYYIENITVFNIFLIFYSDFIHENKHTSFLYVMKKLKSRYNQLVLRDQSTYTQVKKVKFDQLGSEVQEGISTMINLFGYSFLFYNSDQNIFHFFFEIFQYSIFINTPKNEHVLWFIPFFDESFNLGFYTLPLELFSIVFDYASVQTKISFLEKRIDTLLFCFLNNHNLEYYFDFVSLFYKCFSEALQKSPDIYLKLIEKGDNLNTFLYTIKNIYNGNFKNRDIFLEVTRGIWSSIAALSDDCALLILEVSKSAIDVVFKESKLFSCVEKLINVMDDSSANLFIEKLFQYSADIVQKTRVWSTLNVMTKIAQKIGVLKETQNLLSLAPQYLAFFNANKDQIPLVINFASLVADKCHPLGNVLFDTIYNVVDDNILNLSKWEILSASLCFCFDQNRAFKVADLIILASSNENIDNLFNNKDVCDCIFKLKQFADNTVYWPEKLANLMCNIHSMPEECNSFIKLVISQLSNEKLEQLAENCVNRIRNKADVPLFIQNVNILMLITNESNFDMPAFVEKHRDIFVGEWPAEVEVNRSFFINI